MSGSTYGLGGYATTGAGTENWYVMRPRITGSYRGIIALHGGGGDELFLDPTHNPNAHNLMRRIAEQYIVFAPDSKDSAASDGSYTWGNDGSTSTLDAAIAYAQASLGMAAGKVAILGGSMGFSTGCNYARRFPSKVAGLLAAAGVTDLDYHYANGYSASIDAAYGGSWAANGKLPTSHSPVDFAASLTVPVTYWYATDDASVPPTGVGSYVPFFAAYGGAKQAISMGTGGHSDVPWAAIDPQAMLVALAAMNW